MGAQINTVETKHGVQRVAEADGNVVVFAPFPNITVEDTRILAKVRTAVQLVDKLEAQQNIYDVCNMYFSSLPRGKSLRELWQSGAIFINYWPNSPRGEFGVTHSNLRDITLSSWCVDTQSCSMIAATLIHEVAHIAGAPGDRSHFAERAVDKCGFHAEYNPRLLGSLDLFSYMIGRMG